MKNQFVRSIVTKWDLRLIKRKMIFERTEIERVKSSYESRKNRMEYTEITGAALQKQKKIQNESRFHNTMTAEVSHALHEKQFHDEFHKELIVENFEN